MALVKLEALKTVKGIDKNYIEYIKQARTLELYYKAADTKKTAALLPGVERFYKEAGKSLGPTELDYFVILLIRACITLGEFSRAQYWLNRWYEADDVEVSLNLIKLLGLIIYYELGYSSLLESECESAYKTLRKRNRYGLLESEFIRFFKKIDRITDKREKDDLFAAFHNNLLQIKENPAESKLFEYFDFTRWSAVHTGLRGPESR